METRWIIEVEKKLFGIFVSRDEANKYAKDSFKPGTVCSLRPIVWETGKDEHTNGTDQENIESE